MNENTYLLLASIPNSVWETYGFIISENGRFLECEGKTRLSFFIPEIENVTFLGYSVTIHSRSAWVSFFTAFLLISITF